MDQSNGYEGIAREFLRYRGDGAKRADGIGVEEVRRWARKLRRGGSVIDVGCGSGFPLTVVLVEEGLEAFGVDAAPSMVAAFRENLPETPVLCAPVLESALFGRKFDGVLSIGLMFLLTVEEQERLIGRFAEILEPGGSVLFTAPARACVWRDAMTGLESVSLGGERYRELLGDAGVVVLDEYEDAGENHYFEARRRAVK
ncbi:class I SAM-dependent methyltransferase [Occallatibacter savannae]|uniref:class I SAM-dependent methyltransferase n=1 Tax=Occallatibacter savannae TaxID=1002691 RepID=UPI000D68DD41|nr:class I SAM-dependent methyltransferase [Occallatibacter savannae]